MDEMTQLPHRIVVYGDDMLAAVLPNSAKPFNFQKEYSMREDMVRFLLAVKKKQKPASARLLSRPVKCEDICFPAGPEC